MYRRPELTGQPAGEHRAVQLSASGSLWKDALILRDDVSHTLWSQLEGVAIRGEHAGQRLVTYPFERTTYAAWKARYPETKVLVKRGEAAERRQSIYADYFRDPQRLGIFGSENPDARLPGKALVVGVAYGSERAAIALGAVQQRVFIDFELAGHRAVALYDSTASAVRVFVAPDSLASIRRLGAAAWSVGDRHFDFAGHPIDAGDFTGRGRPIDAGVEPPGGGPIGSNEPFTRLDATVVFWFAWAEAYPTTRLVGAE